MNMKVILIPIKEAKPSAYATADQDVLSTSQLVYSGVQDLCGGLATQE